MKLSKEAKTGLLATLALVALIWGINYLKGTELFTTYKKYCAIYTNVDGLVPSNPVLLSGFKVGQVDKMEYTEDNTSRILVTLRIRKDVFVSKSTKANIVTGDLLGSKSVMLEYGEDKTPANKGDTLPSELKTSLASQVGPLKDKAESLIQSLDSVAHGLHRLLNGSSGNSLTNALKNFEETSASLNMLVSSEKSKLRMMIDNAESISHNLKNNNEKLTNIIDNFSQISDSLVKANISRTIINANKTLEETSAIMGKINKGEGTLGLLINNDSLYNRLSNGAADLDKLLIDLKANPRRYVHFSVFGKSDKAK